MHAITLPHSPEKLRQETFEAAAMYLAAGFYSLTPLLIFNRFIIILLLLLIIILLIIIKVLTQKRVKYLFKVIFQHMQNLLGY